MGAAGGSGATRSSSQQGPKGEWASPSGCEGGGLLKGWGQGRGSSYSAEARHLEAGFAAFGPAGQKGGNVRNIPTQQSPPPPQLRDGRWGGLIAENMQMAEARLALPPSLPSLPPFPF